MFPLGDILALSDGRRERRPVLIINVRRIPQDRADGPVGLENGDFHDFPALARKGAFDVGERFVPGRFGEKDIQRSADDLLGLKPREPFEGVVEPE